MKRLLRAVAMVLGMLSTGPFAVVAQADCAGPTTWPSFAEVVPTARAIVLVKVTKSEDGIAGKARLVEVMKGGSPQWLDLRDLEPGRTNGGCPEPDGPYAQVGDRLAIAMDGTAADREGRVDAVAHVGRMRDGRNLSGLERLTFDEARAYDASEPDRPDTPRASRPPPRSDPFGDVIRAIPKPVRSLIGDVLDTVFAVDWPARPPAPLPPGAIALELATEAPAPPTRPDRMGWGCMQAGYGGRLIVDAGELTTEPGPVLWPRGFSGRLVDDLGELVAPDGTVVGREGEMVEAGGGWIDDVFLVCTVDGISYGPAS